MAELVTDPNDPRLTHGEDVGPVGQADAYLVLSREELAKGYVRPVRRNYWHAKCGVVTNMSLPIAETYARNPKFYGGTYCVGCRMHLPVGEHGDFYWATCPSCGPSEGIGDYIDHMMSHDKVGM
jgi:hypothetical protein